MNSKAFFTATIGLGIVLVIFAASINSIIQLNLSESEAFAQQINETNRLWQNAYFELTKRMAWNDDCTGIINAQEIVESVVNAFGEGSECEIHIVSTSGRNNVTFNLTCTKQVPSKHRDSNLPPNSVSVSKQASYEFPEVCEPIEEE
ncbi:MAG: hypothetical protein ABIA76_03205 [Candidatus Diapherotrites archaeon]